MVCAERRLNASLHLHDEVRRQRLALGRTGPSGKQRLDGAVACDIECGEIFERIGPVATESDWHAAAGIALLRTVLPYRDRERMRGRQRPETRQRPPLVRDSGNENCIASSGVLLGDLVSQTVGDDLAARDVPDQHRLLAVLHQLDPGGRNPIADDRQCQLCRHHARRSFGRFRACGKDPGLASPAGKEIDTRALALLVGHVCGEYQHLPKLCHCRGAPSVAIDVAED